MVSEAFAMSQNAQSAQGGNPYGGIIMLVLMFAVFYFLLIRPQQKRAKQHKELIENLKSGDQVVTAGGLHGRVSAIEDNTATLEIASGVKVKINRASVVNKQGE